MIRKFHGSCLQTTTTHSSLYIQPNTHEKRKEELSKDPFSSTSRSSLLQSADMKVLGVYGGKRWDQSNCMEENKAGEKIPAKASTKQIFITLFFLSCLHCFLDELNDVSNIFLEIFFLDLGC